MDGTSCNHKIIEKNISMGYKISSWAGLNFCLRADFCDTMKMSLKMGQDFWIKLAILSLLYAGSVWLLSYHKWLKAIGIILFILAYLWNIVLIASPYDTQAEFKLTRIFLAFGLAAGIFLICRRSIVSRLLGVLVIILTICAALLGSTFMYDKLHP